MVRFCWYEVIKVLSIAGQAAVAVVVDVNVGLQNFLFNEESRRKMKSILKNENFAVGIFQQLNICSHVGKALSKGMVKNMVFPAPRGSLYFFL